MPSVRSRIKQFESLSGENDKSNEEPNRANKPAKKFLYPGHSTQLDQRQSPIDHVINPQATKQSGEHHNGMSNKLEEVWSVRRNIGIGRNVNSTISQLTSNMYSRHGALPATAGQPHLPPVVSKKDAGELTSFGRSRSPLQDHNQDGGRLRNIRAGGYSYSDAKRSHDLPPNMDISSSASKHKSLGIAAMIRPSDNGLLPPVNHKNDKKRRYAEKMANAHLKSAGIGEYTPKSTYYTKMQSSSSSHGDEAAGPSSRWKPRSSSEDDDFDF